jgi:acyl-CoA thioester hydrolase
MEKRNIIYAYKRSVQYYETDRMAIMHNSNYYRWFEEARVHFMSQDTYPLLAIEEMGIFLPVAASDAEFLKPSFFGQTFYIISMMSHFTGYKMTIDFKMVEAETRIVHATGHMKHGVISRDGKPIMLQKQYPEVYEQWQSMLNVPSVIDEGK